MAKEDGASGSEHRHRVVARKRHRLSSAEIGDCLVSLFVLFQHVRGHTPPHPSLLAHALAVCARVVGEASANIRDTIPDEEVDDGYEP